MSHHQHHHNFKHHEHDHKHRNKQHDKTALTNLSDRISSAIADFKPHSDDENPKNGPDAWKALQHGNNRFASGDITDYLLHIAHEISPERRAELGLGQHPFAVVLTCSDSRVSPELIFNQGLGDIFVVRTAGNVPDNVALGSIEYGLLHLKAPLLVVLGHSKCGAVTATLDSIEAVASGTPAHGGEEDSQSHITNIVQEIKPPANRAFTKYGPGNAKLLSSAVKYNAVNVRINLPTLSVPIKHLVESGAVTIVSAVYDLDSGIVTQV